MPNEDRRSETEAALASILARIEEHPLNSPQMKEARAFGKENHTLSRREMAEQLREKALPGVGKQTWTMFSGLPTLARLNRKRIKLEQELATSANDGI